MYACVSRAYLFDEKRKERQLMRGIACVLVMNSAIGLDLTSKS